MDYYLLALIAAGFFITSICAGAETAFSNYPRSRIKSVFERLDSKNNYTAVSSYLHASLLLTRTLGNILVISLVTILVIRLEYNKPPDIWKLVSIIIFVLGVLVFFGQVFPVILAARNPERFVKRFFPLISFCHMFFKPLSRIFVGIGKTFGPEDSSDVYGGYVTEKDLIDVIDAGEKEGTIEKEEKLMLHSVIEFGDKIVREVMIPRIEMVCLEENAVMDEVLSVCENEGFSRIPVYKENVDNIVGILYTRDLLKLFKTCNEDNTSIKEIIHNPIFVPETKLISDLFREFKKKKTHMAVVVDEYGGTAGLITLEDLIEEIVGEIQDEYDMDEEKAIVRVSSGLYIAQAKTPVDEINKTLDLSLEESDDFDTIGGFIIDQMGKIPKSGELVRLTGLELTILEADERSIKKIRIKKAVKEQDDHGQQKKG